MRPGIDVFVAQMLDSRHMADSHYKSIFLVGGTFPYFSDFLVCDLPCPRQECACVVNVQSSSMSSFTFSLQMGDLKQSWEILCSLYNEMKACPRGFFLNSELSNDFFFLPKLLTTRIDSYVRTSVLIDASVFDPKKLNSSVRFFLESVPVDIGPYFSSENVASQVFFSLSSPRRGVVQVRPGKITLIKDTYTLTEITTESMQVFSEFLKNNLSPVAKAHATFQIVYSQLRAMRGTYLTPELWWFLWNAFMKYSLLAESKMDVRLGYVRPV